MEEKAIKSIKNIHFNIKNQPMNFEIIPLTQFIEKILPKIIHRSERVHCYMMFFLTQGETPHDVDTYRYYLKKGDFIVIAPKQVQQYHEQLASCDGFFLLFNHDFFNLFVDDLNFIMTSQFLNPVQGENKITIDSHYYDFIKSILNMICIEYSMPCSVLDKEIIRKYLILMFFILEKVKLKVFEPKNKNHFLSDFKLFQNLLEESFMSCRNVDFYAKKLNMTSKRLSYITQTVLGKSAKEYIDERVILEAKRLLLYSGKSVKEVCFELNFDEPTNFVKYFKKHTQQTPSSLKKNQS